MRPISQRLLSLALMINLAGLEPGSAAGEPAAPPVSAEPRETSATFGDWVVRCSRTPDPASKRICEVAQALVVKGQQAPIVQIAIGVVDRDKLLTVLLPVSIAFAKPPTLGTDDAHAVTLTLRRCGQGGCLADSRIDTLVLKEMRSATKPGRLTFLDAADRLFTVPISFLGLPQALDQLAKQTTDREPPGRVGQARTDLNEPDAAPRR